MSCEAGSLDIYIAGASQPDGKFPEMVHQLVKDGYWKSAIQVVMANDTVKVDLTITDIHVGGDDLDSSWDLVLSAEKFFDVISSSTAPGAHVLIASTRLEFVFNKDDENKLLQFKKACTPE